MDWLDPVDVEQLHMQSMQRWTKLTLIGLTSGILAAPRLLRALCMWSMQSRS